jgi:hypothetical protein
MGTRLSGQHPNPDLFHLSTKLPHKKLRMFFGQPLILRAGFFLDKIKISGRWGSFLK